MNVVTNFGMGGAQETIVQAAELIDPRRVHLCVLAGACPEPDPGLMRRSAAAGVTVEILAGLGRPIRPGRDGSVLGDLTRRWVASPPDIVHTHSSKAGVIGRMAAFRSGAPFVVHTVHGWSVNPGTPPLLRCPVTRLERFLGRRTSMLLTVSEADRDWGLAHGIGRPGSYRVVRSGVPLARFSSEPGAGAKARARLGLDSGAAVVGSVMRLCAQKDPGCLLRAFAAALPSVPQAKLVIVGNGPMEAEVHRWVSGLGLEDAVLLTGGRGDVSALLPAFDVFALSSTWEGLPRVVIEAMAAGVPVVATDVGGLTEVIRDGTTGLLVAPRAPRALARGMVALLGDRERAARMAEAGRGAIAGFDARLMAQDLTSVYESLAGRRTRCAS